MEQKKLYPVLVFKKDSLFYCLVKELGILEKGADLVQTYVLAHQKIQETLQRYQEANLTPPLESMPTHKNIRRSLWKSSLNLGIICFFLLIPVVSLLQPVTKLINRIAYFFELTPTDAIIKIGNRIDKMTTEEKENLKHAICVIQEEFSSLNLSQ